jgi:ketosteroid isomerase-like protein
MTNDEKEVHAATIRFYDAIETMCSGNGTEAMRDAWHHTPRVTGSHPSGDWSQGWEEIWTTWEVFAGLGRASLKGSQLHGLKVHVYGDVAYTTSTFTASPGLGGDAIACTNVLHRQDGVWKIIHHHADKSPAMGAALEKLAFGG